MADPVLWAELRRDQVADVAARGGVALLPVGAIEQHGPHLPLGTDATAAMAVCVRAARAVRTPPVLVLPPIWWGISPYWMGFSGTLTLRPRVLLDVVTDVCASVARHGFQQVVLVNGHGGNDGLLQAAVAQASTSAFRVTCVSYWTLARQTLREVTEFDEGMIGHAGEAETSVGLYLQPDCVDLAAVAADQCVEIPIARRTVAVDVGAYEAPNPQVDAPHGVYGRATAGSAEKGQRIIEAAAAALAVLVRSLQPEHAT
jgi:creatinine amidohydrolase